MLCLQSDHKNDIPCLGRFEEKKEEEEEEKRKPCRPARVIIGHSNHWAMEAVNKLWG